MRFFNDSATDLEGNYKTMGGGAGKDEGPINHSLGIFFWLALTLCHFNVQIVRVISSQRFREMLNFLRL